MRRLTGRLLAVLASATVLTGLIAVPAQAAPLNDNFGAATVLTGARVTKIGESNTGASAEPGEPLHAGQSGGASIWYSWTPSASGTTAISTAGSNIDTLVAVYVGPSVNALTTIASNDDATNTTLTSRVLFNATGGTVYRIAVDGYVGEQGSINLKLFEGPPATTLVSLGNTGAQGNDDSVSFVTSQDGNDSSSNIVNTGGDVVAFMSRATNLVIGDTNTSRDVFVRNSTLATTVRASVPDPGTANVQGNNDSTGPSMSSDGNVVAFESTANNLVLVDNNGLRDVFSRNISGLTTTRVSIPDPGTGQVQSNGTSFNPSISPDGTTVGFESGGTNLVLTDTNGLRDIFVRSIAGLTTTRANVPDPSTGAAQAVGGASWDPALGSNGTMVAFESNATNLVLSDANTVRDVFVHNSAAVTQPSGCPGGVGGVLAGGTKRVSVGTGAVEGNGSSFDPSISSDGRYVAFASSATNFLATDTNAADDIFVHDLCTGITTRASVRSETGFQGKNDSQDPFISADGRYVAFWSISQNLVKNDMNDAVDVFVRDANTGFTTRMSVATGGTEGTFHSRYPSISGNNGVIVFQSASDNLVPADLNGVTDVFARPLNFGPDMLMKKSTDKSYSFDGVYDPTGLTEKLPMLKVVRGKTYIFNARIQNDGSVDDKFLVTGCKNSKGFKVTWLAGSTNITTAVGAGTYNSGLMQPDGEVNLTLSILITPTAKLKSIKSCLVTATSVSNATAKDGAIAQLQVKR